MEKVQWKGGTLLSPVPAVLVSCGTMEKPTALTIAWTGIICSDPPKTYISVRPERNSYDIIKQSGEFVINMMPATDCCDDFVTMLNMTIAAAMSTAAAAIIFNMPFERS